MSKEPVKCPQCGDPVYSVESWSRPYRCSRCKSPITREGLLIDKRRVLGGSSEDSLRVIKSETVREIGKGGRVIWEYMTVRDVYFRTTDSEKACALLAQILRLEDEWNALGETLEMRGASDTKWNCKAARRRFRRWFNGENRRRPLELKDESLRELARNILAVGQKSVRDDDEIEETVYERWDEIQEYEERKAGEKPLLLSNLPLVVRGLIGEAQEAFRWGLERSCCVICRTVLEDVVRRAVSAYEGLGAAIPITDDRLETLLNCLPSSLVDKDISYLGHMVRKAGNAAVHATDETGFRYNSSTILRITVVLVGYFLERMPTESNSG